MGWTSTFKRPGQSIKEFFEREFNYDKPAEKRSGKILAIKAKLKVAYMAYEVIDGNSREVVGIVCLLQHSPRSEFNFSYKDITETMGPYESECPAEILDLLTPTNVKYAIEWRERCREHNKKIAVKIKPGMKVRFKVPISFRDGSMHQELTFEKRNTFSAGYGRYRVSNWKSLEWEIVPR